MCITKCGSGSRANVSNILISILFLDNIYFLICFASLFVHSTKTFDFRWFALYVLHNEINICLQYRHFEMWINKIGERVSELRMRVSECLRQENDWMAMYITLDCVLGSNVPPHSLYSFYLFIYSSNFRPNNKTAQFLYGICIEISLFR